MTTPDFVVEPSSEAGHTQTIQRALDECSRVGGGRVVLRAGTHRSGTIHLRSRVDLHLEKDSVLIGSADLADYGQKIGKVEVRLNSAVATALVFADGAEDISITGEGSIDGNAGAFLYKRKKEEIPAWVEEKKKFGTWIPGFECATKPRPRALVLLVSCRHVRMEEVRVQNSPSWTIHLLACTEVKMRHVTVRGWLDGSNTDGIDLDGCSDVVVEDCDVETGDDAIALKNTNAWGLKQPSRNVVVRRCRLASSTHGFTVGTETQDDFEDIVLEDSHIEKAGEIATKTGIGLSMVDGAALRRVRISNVTVSDAIGPIQIRLANAGRGQAVPAPGIIEDILLENISIERAQGNNMILGLPGHPLRRVTLRHLKFAYTGGFDMSHVPAELPPQEKEFPDDQVWRYLPAYGFFCRDVEGLELTNVSLTAPATERRPALSLQHVSPLTCRDVQIG